MLPGGTGIGVVVEAVTVAVADFTAEVEGGWVVVVTVGIKGWGEGCCTICTVVDGKG